MAGWLTRVAGFSLGTGLLALCVPYLSALAPWATVDLTAVRGLFASLPILAPLSAVISSAKPFACVKQNYSTQIVSLDPLVIYIHSFLNDGDIAALLATAEPLFYPSRVNRGGYNQDTLDRTSWSAGLPRDDPAVECVLSRAETFLGTMMAPGRDDMGTPQLVRYTAGQRFNIHNDWFPRPVASYDGRNATFNRVASFFAILQDNCTGGETHFPFIKAVTTQERADKEKAVWREHEDGGLAFRPVAGNAIFWVNLFPNGMGDRRVKHSGLPVIDGLKTAMNIWPRQYYGPEAWNWPEKRDSR